MAVTTIETGTNVATLVNVFTVDPARQRALVNLLVRATEETMRHRPGFVAANIHAGIDGTRVVNYAQWESVDAFRAMLADSRCQEHMAAVTAIAQADPQFYTVESVHHA
jgi:quinol monooxygenase YgiN